MKKQKYLLFGLIGVAFFAFLGFVCYQIGVLKNAAAPAQNTGCPSCHAIREEHHILHVAPRLTRVVVFVHPHAYAYPVYGTPVYYDEPHPKASFHFGFGMVSHHHKHRYHR